MPSGGRREGAGRPRKAEQHARPIAAAEKKIADKLPHLVGKMLELGDGIMVQVENEITGERHLYTRPPDRQALEYLLNRIMGKPTERQEVEQSGGVTIRVEYADPDPAAPAPGAADALS